MTSSSWPHCLLAHPFQCRAIGLEVDRRILNRVVRGEGHQLASLSPEPMHHELLNWIIDLGILGDRPSEIVDVRESHTQLAFRAAAIWE